MSTIKLTRAQRRRMKKLVDEVDIVSQADRRLFERFPHRQHRVRLASAAELQQHELLEGAPLAIPPGFEIGDVR